MSETQQKETSTSISKDTNTKDDLIIREALDEDISQLVQLEGRWHEEEEEHAGSFPGWDERKFRQKLSQPGSSCFVAVTPQKEVIGFIFYETSEDNIVSFSSLIVKKLYRRLGVGVLVIQAAIRKLISRERWPCAVRLTVNEKNEPALSMYAKYGFQLLQKIPDYYSVGQAALVMVLILNADEFLRTLEPVYKNEVIKNFALTENVLKEWTGRNDLTDIRIPCNVSSSN